MKKSRKKKKKEKYIPSNLYIKKCKNNLPCSLQKQKRKKKKERRRKK